MPALVAGIHVLVPCKQTRKTWMAGSFEAKTALRAFCLATTKKGTSYARSTRVSSTLYRRIRARALPACVAFYAICRRGLKAPSILSCLLAENLTKTRIIA